VIRSSLSSAGGDLPTQQLDFGGQDSLETGVSEVHTPARVQAATEPEDDLAASVEQEHSLQP
jgi:hypothetical protein